MHGLAGWFGQSPNTEPNEAILSKMAQISDTSPATNKVSVTESSALYCSADLIRQDNTIAAIYGMPRWRDTTLQQLANNHSPATVLLKAYQLHKDRLFAQLGGEFTFVIIDLNDNTLLGAMDRIGIHQLYYGIINNCLVFSTSAKSLLRFPGAKPNISEQSLFGYMYFHMIPSPDCIYRGFHKLAGGHTLFYSKSKGSLTVNRYWHPQFEEHNSRTLDDLNVELMDTIIESTRFYSKDKRTGCFLSGGLDSSTVTGALAKVSPNPVATFTIGFNEKDYDEREYANVVASHFATDHHEYLVTADDVVDTVPIIAAFYDEPFGNSSVLPAFYCAKLAVDKGMQRLLAGDGGDEIFAGNERYAKQAIFEAYARIPSFFRHILLEPTLSKTPGLGLLPIIRKARSYIEQANTPLPDRLETYNFLHRTALSNVFSDDFLSIVDTRRPLSLLRNVYQEPREASSLNRMLYLDWQRTLHDNDLVKVNKMCELAGIEVAYPLLDDRLLDFSLKVPSNLKLKNGNLRWFFRQAVKGFLPEKILNKKKHGFGLPFGVWTYSNKRLQTLAYDNLESLKKRGYFKANFIDQAINLHRSGHAAYYGELVWILMILELWLASR